MGKRKNDKLETMYQNIDLKFKDASEEEIRDLRDRTKRIKELDMEFNRSS